jgi:hypothetical protein
MVHGQVVVGTWKSADTASDAVSEQLDNSRDLCATIIEARELLCMYDSTYLMSSLKRISAVA